MPEFHEVKDFFSDISEAWQELPADDRADITGTATVVPLTLWSLYKVVRAARKGDYSKATFWAVMWGAWNLNYSQTAIHRRLRTAAKEASRSVFD